MVCGSILLSKCGMMPRGRSKKEHMDSDSRNLHSGRSEEARRNEDMGCSSEVMAERLFSQLRTADEECRVKGKSSEWSLGTTREACEKVVKEEAGRLGIIREFWRKRTDFLKRIITLSYICPHCNSFLSGGLYLVGIDGKEALQLVVCNLWRKI